jgi:putative thioredoxin
MYGRANGNNPVSSMETIIGEQPSAGNGALIKDGDSASFMADVIEASAEVPVIVDFWAPWCGPCKELGPAIEKVVTAAGGAVRLVKVNIDENQDLAQQMRIQSIPAVYAFKDGRPVDAFTGAVPESQIKAFVERLFGPNAIQPSPVQQALEQAKAALDGGDHVTAGTIYSQVLAHEPGNAAATAGLARCRIAAGELAEARQLLEGLPQDARETPDAAAAHAALELAEKAGESAGNLGELRARLERDPADPQARHDLAMGLYAASEHEEAIDELIELVRRHGQWNEEAARKELVQIFEALGHAHELTVSGRRRLSSVLFS